MVGSVRVLADDRRMSHESRETADFNFPLTYMGKNVLAPGQIQVEVIFGKEEKQKSVTVKAVKAKDTAPLPLVAKFLF